MATPVQQAAIPPPDVVANAFVHQYYLILHQSPELVHRFYQDVSKLGRPEEGGLMRTTTTIQAIDEKLVSFGHGQFRAEIASVDSQESYHGGVLVLVTGYLTGSNNRRQKFSQSFFLAPQDTGYFVLNDVFRYVDDINQLSGDQDPDSNVEAPSSPNQESSTVLDNHISEQTITLSERVNGEELHNPSENEVVSIVEEETHVPEAVDEIPDESQMGAESDTKIEEVQKKSYASILKDMRENAAPFSNPTSTPPRSAPKIQEQVTTTAPPLSVADTHGSSTNATEDGNVQEGEVGGPSIYVKGLPLDAMPALLENEFKKFGLIRPGGIQVRSQKGFCFGFVEFDEASAVRSAIEASPVMINGCRVFVEEKRSTSRGNNRGRFSGGGPGYRSEGARGRGNFGGGKAYSRGDFSSRTESGNRGSSRSGFSNRGGDGYRRDRAANNGGRTNRASGLAFNAAAKNMAPRVSATA